MIQLTAEDGFTFGAFKASPAGPSKGGIVIIQEIFGVTDQLKSLAQSYADDGFNVIVPALFDRHTPGTVVAFDAIEQGREMAMSLKPEHILLDVAAAAKEVDTGHGVSVIGFCWGGGQAYRMACQLTLAGAVAYYGTALDKHMAEFTGGPKCPMLFHFGAQDAYTPEPLIDAVRQAVPSAAVETYNAGHAFANDARTTYVADAATSARSTTIEFLGKHHNAA